MAMEYDEDRELTQYIWHNFRHHMSEFEYRVWLATIGREKAAETPSAEVIRLLKAKWGQVNEADANAALMDGPQTFRHKVCSRVLAEAGDPVFLNRCARCNRLVRTPKARQCFWYGFDWH